MSAVVHSSVLACASGLSTGDVGLDAGTPNDSRGVSLVARTLSNDDVLAKGGDTLATGRDALFMGVNSGREEPQIAHIASTHVTQRLATERATFLLGRAAMAALH
jgi:hypothetical protein